METKVYPDQELLMGVAAGEEPAFRQLYMKYAPKVYHMALKYLPSPFTAQDAVQEIFTRVWEKRAELTEIQHFDAWLTTVTRNHLINVLRKKVPSPLTDGMEETLPNPDLAEHKTEYRQLEQVIEEAINLLTPAQQRVYRLREMGYSHKEIADQLDISYNTAREHMSKSLQSIRNYLIRHYNDLLPALYLLLIRELL